MDNTGSQTWLLACRCDDRFPPLACLPGSERAAISTLKHSDWNLELAFEIFYSGGPPEPSHFLQPSRPSTDPSRIEALYIKYKGRPNCFALATAAKAVAFTNVCRNCPLLQDPHKRVPSSSSRPFRSSSRHHSCGRRVKAVRGSPGRSPYARGHWRTGSAQWERRS